MHNLQHGILYLEIYPQEILKQGQQCIQKIIQNSTVYNIEKLQTTHPSKIKKLVKWNRELLDM